MRLSLYRRHLDEIGEFVREVLLPDLREMAQLICASGKRWHNWTDRVLMFGAAGILICVDTASESYGPFANNHVIFYIQGKTSLYVDFDGNVLPESHNINGWTGLDYREGTVAALVGAVRAYDKKVLMLSAEADALEY